MGIPLNIDWQQILLHLFNFAILAAGLYILLYKPVKDFMSKRTKYYAQMNADAESKLEHATALEKEHQAQLEKVDDELRQKKELAAKELETAKHAELQAAHAEAETIISNAKTAAQTEYDKILASAQEEIGELAAAAAGRLIHTSMEQVCDDFFAAAGGEHQDGQSHEE